ncbi:MAG TPA: hypothetical protein VGR49_06055 [Actinomycetota bacterium]|nr:hypothetical protein [Actinomycetota bacterium]
MKSRLFALVFCWLLLAVGCTSEGQQPDTNGPSPSPPGRAGVFQITGGCAGLHKLRGPQVSFVLGGELYVARRSGNVARCVLEIPQPLDVNWGPEGDRVQFGDLRRYEGDGIVALDDVAESVAWSRPTGRAIVYVSEGRLMKVDAFGDQPIDISFLADHDEVVYHPAGTHIAVTGTADDGTYGLWLATNVGKDVQLLAIGEDARRIFSLSFAHDGTTIYYAAEHDDHYDVHSLRLALQDKEGATRNAELGTVDSSSTEMGDVIVSEFAPESVAYTVGSCEEGKTTRVWNGSVTELEGELAGLSTEPVGWLPSGELLVLAREAGCEGDGTLYAWRPDQATRLVPGVSAAGVRAVLPPPPDPPASEQQAVA